MLSRPLLRRLLAGCGLALLAGVVGQAAAAEAPTPAFHATACDLPDPSRLAGPTLRCGTVSVPRDYAHPGAGTFKLAVVVVASAHRPALPDPVVYISGGPGSPLTIYAEYQARHPYAADRDLILVDQRATGRSEPRLCPDLNGALVDAVLALASEDTTETRARVRALRLACRDAAVASGIDLRDFGTAVTVEDFERVRQALGIAQWNVFGESYGTTVAMTLMARHPATVRSAVLDSVYPPDPILPRWSVEVAAAREAFFAACDQDADCGARYPGLAATYQQVLDRLRRSPATVPLAPAFRYPGNEVRATAALFEFVVSHLIYYPVNYPGLPRMIAAVGDGDMIPFAASLASLLAAAREAGSQAAYTAVECRDRPRFREPLANDADVMDLTLLYGTCVDWSELGPAPEMPADTSVPTLVLAGQFDPNADPAISHSVAERIGASARWLVFPWIGHNVRHFSGCAAGLVAAFIQRPAEPLDGACAQRRIPVSFLPRRSCSARTPCIEEAP